MLTGTLPTLSREQAKEMLEAAGAKWDVVNVPGALEIPLALQKMADKHRRKDPNFKLLKGVVLKKAVKKDPREWG